MALEGQGFTMVLGSKAHIWNRGSAVWVLVIRCCFFFLPDFVLQVSRTSEDHCQDSVKIVMDERQIDRKESKENTLQRDSGV